MQKGCTTISSANEELKQGISCQALFKEGVETIEKALICT